MLFNPEDRYEVEVRGDDYLILRERDIHAVARQAPRGGPHRPLPLSRPRPATGVGSAVGARPYDRPPCLP